MIELRFIDLERAGPASMRLLNDEECARAVRLLDPAAAAGFVVRRTVLRRALADLLNVEAAGLRFGQGPQGKPHLTDHRYLHFSASSREKWLMLVTSRAVEVGCDIEVERDSAELLSALAAAPRGHADKHVCVRQSAWILQEARLKALGVGFAADPTFEDNTEIGAEVVNAPAGFQAAIAWRGCVRPKIVCRTASG